MRLKHHLTAYRPERPGNVAKTSCKIFLDQISLYSSPENSLGLFKKKQKQKKPIPCPGRGHDPVRGLWRGLWVGTVWAYSFHYHSLTCPSPVCPVQFSSPTKRLRKGKYIISVLDQESYDSRHVCLLLWVNFKVYYVLMA